MVKGDIYTIQVGINMFDLIFEGRDRKVSHLLKASDSIGRSLRENVKLLSVDDNKKEVIFLTENDKVIKAKYHIDEDVLLSDIEVEDGELFRDSEKFDNIVGVRVSQFIEKIYEDEISDAEDSFSSILNLWENRIKFEDIRKRMEEEQEKFNYTNKIIETEEFSNFLEILPQVVSFLQDNEESFNKIPEIKNGAKLSEALSTAFNIPKVSYEDLENMDTYDVEGTITDSIYEMICKQELIKKELIESKINFEGVWATHEKISTLASLVFESDKEKVAKALVECAIQVPYLAFTTKKQLFTTLQNNLSVNDGPSLNESDIKKYASKLFELKKPIKEVYSTVLNEKYGVNINNLRDTPSLRSLLNTQVVIFEALSRLSPKGTVQKKVLNEVAQMLKTKNGGESIDVNDYLQIMFEESGYKYGNDTPISESFKIGELASEIHNIDELVAVLSEQMGEDDEEQMQRQSLGATDTFDAPGNEEEAQAQTDSEEEEAQAADAEEDELADKEAEEKGEGEEETEDEAKKRASEEEEEPPKKLTLSKEKVMKGIKDLEQMMSGLDIGKEEVGDE